MNKQHTLEDRLSSDYNLHCQVNCPMVCGFADVLAKNADSPNQE
jgi:hypothetical protein